MAAMTDVRHVLVLATGGTIASVTGRNGYLRASQSGRQSVADLLAEDLGEGVEVRVEVKQAWAPKLSEDLSPSDWVVLAETIAKHARDSMAPIDGLVITHGTDTLAFTASAMCFLLKNLTIPVVFTGALFPPSHPSSDAEANLNRAVRFAAEANVAGVFVLFAARRGETVVRLASRTRSIAGYSRAFPSVDGRGVACFLKDGTIEYKPLRKELPTRGDHPSEIEVDPRLDDRATILRVYPGFRAQELVMLAEMRSYRAIILELYHSGTACTRERGEHKYSLVQALRRCKELGVPVFGLPMDRSAESGLQYESTREMVGAGLIPLPPMALEAAYTKLLCALGRTADPDSLIALMRTDLALEVFRPRFK